MTRYCNISVSYTHLDVYKRQTNESAKPYFLLCTELTGYMPDELLPSEDMFRFYDKNGKEIPRWYDSYSGSMDGSSIAVAQGSIYKAE